MTLDARFTLAAAKYGAAYRSLANVRALRAIMLRRRYANTDDPTVTADDRLRAGQILALLPDIADEEERARTWLVRARRTYGQPHRPPQDPPQRARAAEPVDMGAFCALAATYGAIMRGGLRRSHGAMTGAADSHPRELRAYGR